MDSVGEGLYLSYTHVVGVGDVVLEGPGAGDADVIESPVSFTMPGNVESLVLTGSAAANATGSIAADTLIGNSAANQLDGQGGGDLLEGQGGADTLLGGAGADTLSGGAGADVFVFQAAPTSGSVDLLQDFTPGSDALHLDEDAFGALSPGALAPGQFAAGAGLRVAQDADDRILYDTSSGTLYYDADGSGPAVAVAFAVLGSTTHPVVSAADFLVVG